MTRMTLVRPLPHWTSLVLRGGSESVAVIVAQWLSLLLSQSTRVADTAPQMRVPARVKKLR
jgi:hypothetical protein